MSTSLALHSYLGLVLVGFLPSEIWRWLGVLLGRSLDEDSEIVLWVRAVATALVAGVIARIVLFPPGGLAGVPLEIRLGAIGCGLAAFFLLRRSPFGGLIVGEAALVIGAIAAGR
ncbi:MAG: AzlD domain-containing protein [Rhizobiales bacterium]|nr:AzlD domain-containing protein [Hyphomicrobiales bacterium]